MGVRGMRNPQTSTGPVSTAQVGMGQSNQADDKPGSRQRDSVAMAQSYGAPKRLHLVRYKFQDQNK